MPLLPASTRPSGKPPPGPRLQDDFLTLLNAPLALVAAAECLAGGLSVSFVLSLPPFVTAMGSACLFGAGACFGHYFDRDADLAEHPDRPLPSGRVEPGVAWKAAWVLLPIGLLLTATGGLQALAFALMTAMAVILYAAVTRRVWGVGFLTLGAAHALNLAVGLSVAPDLLPRYVPAVAAVGLYAAGWAMVRVSRQPGAPPTTSFVALVHLAAAASALIFAARSGFNRPWEALPFLIGLVILAYPRFVNAAVDPRRPAALEAVQYGFLGFTLLSATLAGGYSGIVPALLVALLMVPQYLLLKRSPIQLASRPR